MMSHRQVEQKQRGEVSPSSEQKAAAPPHQKTAKKAPTKVMSPARKAPRREKEMGRPQMAKDNPKPEPEQTHQSEQQTAQVAPPAGEQSTPLGAETQQIQQTIKPRVSEASLIREYLASLKRDIQNHLDYPRKRETPVT